MVPIVNKKNLYQKFIKKQLAMIQILFKDSIGYDFDIYGFRT